MKPARFFDQFPKDIPCLICGTNVNKTCILVPIDGTDEDGICEAQPIHVACLKDFCGGFRLVDDKDILYMQMPRR